MSILKDILAVRRAAVAEKKKQCPLASLTRTADGPRPFFRAGGYTLIAECKQASPSAGRLVENYDPVSLATAYAAGGADALSVLTEPQFFLGADGHLAAARAASGLPVLRKDFLVDPYQVVESWALGADAILLIAAALPPGEVVELAVLAGSLGLQTLLEVHSETELAVVRDAPVTAFGINARSLHDFSIDLDAAAALCALLPPGAIPVAESGLRCAADVARMAAAGFKAFLVGTALVGAPDPAAAVRDLRAGLSSAHSGTD